MTEGRQQIPIHPAETVDVDLGRGFIVTIRPLRAHEAAAVLSRNWKAKEGDVEEEARLILGNVILATLAWRGCGNEPDYDREKDGKLTEFQVNNAFAQRGAELYKLAAVITSSAFLTADQLGNFVALLLPRLGTGARHTTAESASETPPIEPLEDVIDPPNPPKP